MKTSLFRPDFPFSPAKFPIFYGRIILGAIASVQMMLIVVASALGPSLLANSKAVTRSYISRLYACCLFAPVVIGLMVFVRPPNPRKV